MKKNKYRPDNPSHPGETILDLLQERRMKQVDLAKLIRRPTATINGIIKGKAKISAKTALGLEKLFKIDAEFWVTRQALYDLAVERNK